MIKLALIPEANANDVMMQNKYYRDMDIYTVENFRDVIEYAFIDCPKKTDLLKKLLPLTENGASTARKLEPPAEYNMAPISGDFEKDRKPEQFFAEDTEDTTTVTEKRKKDGSNPYPQ